MTNGVKQGGVLSPYLFSLYLDPLTNKIKNSGFGCHMGKTATNVFVYADDVVLLAPTVTSLKRMVDISEEYGKSHKLQFNSIKSEIVIFNNNKNIKIENLKILLNDEKIKISESYKHLNSKNAIDFKDIIKEMKIKCNVIKK